MHKKSLSIVATMVPVTLFILLFFAACAPANEAVLTGTSEPKPTTAPTAAPTATPTTSPIPTPPPEPYFDLENMTDEGLLTTYGLSIEDINKTKGYAYGNSGLEVVEYIADDIACTTMVEYSEEGGECILCDYPSSLYTWKTLMTTDYQTYSDVGIDTIEEILNHDKIFNNEPFPGELIIGEDEVVNVMITRVINIVVYRRYLELQGLSVPETKWSRDMEGLEMLGNVVSIVGMFRYFLTIAPHDEVMNHFKLNYSDTARTITEEP